MQGNGSMSITDVTDVEGDVRPPPPHNHHISGTIFRDLARSPQAYLNNRKGKVRLGFELKCKIKWAGQINDAEGNAVVKCTGTAVLADLDDSMDDDECKPYYPELRRPPSVSRSLP